MRKKNLRVYSRTLPDRTREEHRERMAVRRAEELMRKATPGTGRFINASKLYPYSSPAWRLARELAA